MALGEAWAAKVIQAVLESQAWDRTLLIYIYDEHGGYYDHVPPPAAIPPDTIPPNVNPPGAYNLYGPRVPAIVISPYSAAVVAVCAVAGWLRSGRPRIDEAVGTPQNEGPAPWVAALSLRSVSLLLACCLGCRRRPFRLLQRTSTESSREHFVQAWVLSQPSGNIYSTTAQLGIRNEEGGA